MHVPVEGYTKTHRQFVLDYIKGCFNYHRLCLNSGHATVNYLNMDAKILLSFVFLQPYCFVAS